MMPVVVSDPLPFNTPHTSLCLKGQTQSRIKKMQNFTRAQNVSGRQPLYLRWLSYSHMPPSGVCDCGTDTLRRKKTRKEIEVER